MRPPPLPRPPSAFNDTLPNHSAIPFDNDLLTLPFEIRLDIFKYIFISPTGYVLHDTRNKYEIVDRDRAAATLMFAVDGEGQKSEWELDSALLRVSKAVRKECLNVFYKYNTFYVPLPSDDRHARSWIATNIGNHMYKFAYWLSSGNIQHLALNLFPHKDTEANNTRLILETIDAIPQSPAKRALINILDLELGSHPYSPARRIV